MAECYHYYLDKIYNEWSGERGLRTLHIDYKKQVDLLNSIDTTTFNKLWHYYAGKRQVRIPKNKTIVDSPTPVKAMGLSPSNEMLDILKDLRKDHIAIDTFLTKSSMNQHFETIMFLSDFLPLRKTLDLSDPKMRLFLSYFLFNLNDSSNQFVPRNSIIDKVIGEILKKRKGGVVRLK